MQIDVEIQEEKIKKEVLSKLISVRKVQWKEKKSDYELECNLKKKFELCLFRLWLNLNYQQTILELLQVYHHIPSYDRHIL